MSRSLEANGLNLRELARLNRLRCDTVFAHCGDWGLTDWTNAVAGEAGEACNQTKKMRRGDDLADPLGALGKELADVVIYADLCAQAAGLDLSACIRQKFNEVSLKKGSDILLPDPETATDKV